MPDMWLVPYGADAIHLRRAEPEFPGGRTIAYARLTRDSREWHIHMLPMRPRPAATEPDRTLAEQTMKRLAGAA